MEELRMSGTWDKYMVPIVTTVVGGVVLTLVLVFLGFASFPGSEPKPTERERKNKKDDDSTKKTTAAEKEKTPEKVAPPELTANDLLGEWEQQASDVFGLQKARLIFTKSGRVFFKRGAKVERVKFVVKAGRLELEGVATGKSLVFAIEKSNNVLGFNLDGVTTSLSGFARIGFAKWTRLADYDVTVYDRTPTPMDARLPGKWALEGTPGSTLEIQPNGAVSLFKQGDRQPVLVALFEFYGKTNLEVLINGREVTSMTFAMEQPTAFQLGTTGNPIGDEKQLRGRWKRIP